MFSDPPLLGILDEISLSSSLRVSHHDNLLIYFSPKQLQCRSFSESLQTPKLGEIEVKTRVLNSYKPIKRQHLLVFTDHR